MNSIYFISTFIKTYHIVACIFQNVIKLFLFKMYFVQEFISDMIQENEYEPKTVHSVRERTDRDSVFPLAECTV